MRRLSLLSLVVLLASVLVLAQAVTVIEVGQNINQSMCCALPLLRPYLLSLCRVPCTLFAVSLISFLFFLLLTVAQAAAPGTMFLLRSGVHRNQQIWPKV